MTESDAPLRFFHSTLHACGYWPERDARNLLLDPCDPRLPTLYAQALQWGFRRTGSLLYRPHCPSCRACISVRIPIASFRPNRSQRRCLQRNHDVSMHIVPAEQTAEQLALYQRYLAARHADGGMDTHGTHEFDQFLTSDWSTTRFMELREKNTRRLLAVAVTDVVEDALSAVYTFFDPDERQRSLGTLGVLKQIEWAKRDGRAFLYLGYWINGHDKMHYKRLFQPLEALSGMTWHPLTRDTSEDVIGTI